MLNQESVRRINQKLIQKDGSMKSFTVQLLEYEYGIYPNSLPFVVSNTTMFLNGVDIDNYPLIINQSTVEHIKNKHDINNSFIMHLEKMLRNNVLVMESRKHEDSLVVVTDYFDQKKKPIIVIVRKGFYTGYVLTNQITSVYGKTHLKDLIEATYNDGLQFYPNKKTRHFISSQRLQLPPDVIRALSYDHNIPHASLCQDRKSKHKKLSLEEQISESIYSYQNQAKQSSKSPSPVRAYNNVWSNTR